MKISIKSRVRKGAFGVVFAAFVGVGNAAPLVWDGTLPTAGNPLTSQQYQDFTVYSLNYLSNLVVQSPGVVPTLTSPSYNVASGVGQLQDKIVIVTGNDGNTASNLDTCGNTGTSKTPVSGCDNAYAYPSSAATFFRSSTTPEPSVVVTGEPLVSTWTATAAALRTFLGGNNLIFMFNLNEDNGGDANTLDGQSLLVAMRVQLTNAIGTVLNTFYVGANNAIPLGVTAAQAWTAFGAPNPDPAVSSLTVQNTFPSPNGFISTDPRWAYVHGAISVNATTGAFLAMGDCVFTGLANCKTINQNLGANQVAFAAFNQQLSDLIYTNTGNAATQVAFMNVDTLTSGQSNGFEQLFIVASNVPLQVVPEPGALALAGLALAACFMVGRRGRKTTTSA